MTPMTSQPNAFAIRGATNVLAKAALLDPRIGAGDEGTILAWAEVLQPMAGYPADLLAAVTRHYSTSTERILPADVLRLAREIKNTRINREVGNDSAPPELSQLPPATVEARRRALAEAAANIGKAHDVDTRETFASAPRPARIDSPATIAAKVARARAGWTPPPGDPIDAEVGCDWRDDSDGRTCMLAAGHLGPHHPSKAAKAAKVCGETNAHIDGGAPCARLAGHGSVGLSHTTASGLWWDDETTTGKRAQ